MAGRLPFANGKGSWIGYHGHSVPQCGLPDRYRYGNHENGRAPRIRTGYDGFPRPISSGRDPSAGIFGQLILAVLAAWILEVEPDRTFIRSRVRWGALQSSTTAFEFLIGPTLLRVPTERI